MVLTDDGMYKVSKLEQPLNDCQSINLTDDGIIKAPDKSAK